ncbi:unnamed protein product [Ambrosiozyma monospora]|uniref:Unnamed protein product n=1 Tax=Ambrosiozyma monospora TaxID=43982 RepID=A0ACB5SUJ9_AMBMO|nr:unnamed protein product [Ambrosiozyma monospora]
MTQPNNCSSTSNRCPEKFMNELTPIDLSECNADALVGTKIIQLFHESSKDLYNLFMNSESALNEINGKAEQEKIVSTSTDSNTNTTDTTVTTNSNTTDAAISSTTYSNTKNDKKSKFKEYHELLEFIDEHTRKFNELETLSDDQIEGIRAKSTTPNAIHLIDAVLKLMNKIISNPTQNYKFSPPSFFIFMQFAYGTHGIFKIRSANYDRNSNPTLYIICKNSKRSSSSSSSADSTGGHTTTSTAEDPISAPHDTSFNSSSSSSGESTGRIVPLKSNHDKAKIDHCAVTYTITFDDQRNVVSIKSTGEHNHNFIGDSGLNYLEKTPIFLTKLLSYILSSGMTLGSSQTHLNQFLD